MIDDKAEARETGAKGQEAGQYPVGRPCGAESVTAASGQTKAEMSRLMEAVIERSNLWSAYQKVVRNGGAPGVDGLTVGSSMDWLKMHWPSVRAALLEGRYMPSAVRAVDIPKPSGGVRTLGIPTVLDRLIQQALLQVLQPIVEPTFSASLGYTLTHVGGRIRLKVARQSVARLTGRVHALLRQGRGRNLTHTIDALNRVLRGWIGYFQLSVSKTVSKTLDGWLRRRLRCLLWRQAKTRQRRTAMLRRRGLAEARAWHSGHNGHGPWWNSGASHMNQMNQAYPKAFFDRLKLLSIMDNVSSVSPVNRRMRNRTYGGVGGGRRIPAPSPIGPPHVFRQVTGLDACIGAFRVLPFCRKLRCRHATLPTPEFGGGVLLAHGEACR